MEIGGINFSANVKRRYQRNFREQDKQGMIYGICDIIK
jgi:hypothetical protein